MEWSQVEPVLRVTYRLLSTRDTTNPASVCQELGRPPDDEQTIRALAYLYEFGYVGGYETDQSPAPVVIKATEKGLQVTAGWPGGGDEQVQLLLRLLDERIADDETPEEEKGRLRRARDSFAAVGRDVAVEVLAAFAAQAAGAGAN